jgi:hypothetical protein
VTSGGASGPVAFIFASEDGSISLNPDVPPPVPPPPIRRARWIIAVPPSDAVYKGLAIASTIPGNVAGDFLTLPTSTPAGRRLRPQLRGCPHARRVHGPQHSQATRRSGFAISIWCHLRHVRPQDADAHDDVPGMGHGFINAFDTGHFLVVSHQRHAQLSLGLALAPANWKIRTICSSATSATAASRLDHRRDTR